ncbi:MAG TPA: protein-L-isoaspartate O-methyltransferase [Parvularcula sp.]|nr:protein-L-isoaspartate O-methyltransferase [Parvularcula sp.]HBS33226.1 protein-L-isoaspartate O-methyltransferase [Parvularcula sp.]HBS35604.1 protein-L-isoaspartate O-methyltransferase [Parvularcula sp.]
MDFEAARKHMVDSQVRTNDVTDPRIQRAFETVPRERFLPAELRAQAYIDREVVYAPGRTMPTARDYAKLIDALDIAPGNLILDVACGSGYSTAILASLGEMVVAVENNEPLAALAQENWSAIGAVNAAVISGEPADGAARQGPFDVIVIGQAIEVEPAALLKQLKDGGRLGAFFRQGGVTKGCVWRRAGASAGRADVFDASVRTTLDGFTRPKSFVF